MKVERSQVTKLVITGAPSLDPITVFLEDMPIWRGKVIIECYGKSWSAYWGNMGSTLMQFFCACNPGYITGKLTEAPARVYDPEGMANMLKKEVLRLRRAHDLTKGEAYDMMYEIETMDLEHPFHVRSNLLTQLLGDDWQCALPEKDNPDWVYLERIVKAVQSALRQPEDVKVAEKA
jgi:hypothetical protein